MLNYTMSKVFFLLSTLSTGGGERVASDLSLTFPEEIQKTIVLLENKVSYPYTGNLLSLNIADRNKIYTFLVGLLKLRKLVKKEKPDHVVSFGKMPNLINLFSCKKPILRVDNFYSASCIGASGWFYKKLVTLFFNKAFLVVVISKESADDLVKNFGIKKEKIKVIYNPLSVLRIKEMTKEPLEEKYQYIFKHPVVITMGQLGRQKNQEHLISAFAAAKAKIGDLKLVILGKGSLEDRLKEYAKELKMEHDIHFLGWQKNPFKFIAAAKVFALSSLFEGLPCALLEAMACNTPVASYDCSSGPREILAPATDPLKKTASLDYADFGILVKQGDEKLLAKALVKMILDQDLSGKLREKAFRRATDFDAKNIIKEWDFLYA